MSGFPESNLAGSITTPIPAGWRISQGGLVIPPRFPLVSASSGAVTVGASNFNTAFVTLALPGPQESRVGWLIENLSMSLVGSVGSYGQLQLKSASLSVNDQNNFILINLPFVPPTSITVGGSAGSFAQVDSSPANFTFDELNNLFNQVGSGVAGPIFSIVGGAGFQNVNTTTAFTFTIRLRGLIRAIYGVETA